MKISIFFQRIIVLMLAVATVHLTNLAAMKQEKSLPQQQASPDLEKYVHRAIQALQQNLAHEIWKKKITLKQIPQKVTASLEIDDARDAIREERERMLDAMEEENLENIEILANRYTVNVKDKNGQTPLAVVIKHAPHNSALIEKLIKTGARYTAADRAINIEHMIGNLRTVADAEKFMSDITREIALFKEQGKEEAKVQDDAARAKIFQRIKAAEASSREKAEDTIKMDIELDALAVIYEKYNELYKKYEEKIVALSGKEKLIDSGILEQAKIAANATAAAISLSNYTQSDYFKNYTKQEKETYLRNKTYQVIEVLFEVKKVENPEQETSICAFLNLAEQVPIRQMLIKSITQAGFNGEVIVKNAETKFIAEITEEIKSAINRFKSVEEAQNAAQSIGERIMPLPQEQQSRLLKYYQDKISELTFIDAISGLQSFEEAQGMGEGIKQMINELPQDKQLKLLQLYNVKTIELEIDGLTADEGVIRLRMRIESLPEKDLPQGKRSQLEERCDIKFREISINDLINNLSQSTTTQSELTLINRFIDQLPEENGTKMKKILQDKLSKLELSSATKK